MSNIVLYENRIPLDRLYTFYNLKSRMEKERARYFKMYNSSINLVASILDELPESKTIIRLRREIRLATKGTPQTIAEDAITSAGYISSGTEQLYNAQSHLIKDAYRKLAPLVHPDRRNGNTELFQLVNTAYRLRDLTFLIETYLFLVKDNLYWRCSDEAHNYLKQEIQRPAVSLEILRSKPEFRIAMLYLSGQQEAAREFAKKLATFLIVKLNEELISLLTPKGFSNHESSNEESSQEARSEVGSGQETRS